MKDYLIVYKSQVSPIIKNYTYQIQLNERFDISKAKREIEFNEQISEVVFINIIKLGLLK